MPIYSSFSLKQIIMTHLQSNRLKHIKFLTHTHTHTHTHTQNMQSAKIYRYVCMLVHTQNMQTAKIYRYVCAHTQYAKIYRYIYKLAATPNRRPQAYKLTPIYSSQSSISFSSLDLAFMFVFSLIFSHKHYSNIVSNNKFELPSIQRCIQ